jgi:hypothetical protein
MLDCLSTLAHGLWVCIKALLRSLEQMLMLPSRNPPLWPGRALRFERTFLTGCGPVTPQHLAVFFVCIAIRQSLPSWTGSFPERRGLKNANRVALTGLRSLPIYPDERATSEPVGMPSKVPQADHSQADHSSAPRQKIKVL